MSRVEHMAVALGGVQSKGPGQGLPHILMREKCFLVLCRSNQKFIKRRAAELRPQRTRLVPTSRRFETRDITGHIIPGGLFYEPRPAVRGPGVGFDMSLSS